MSQKISNFLGIFWLTVVDTASWRGELLEDRSPFAKPFPGGTTMKVCPSEEYPSVM